MPDDELRAVVFGALADAVRRGEDIDAAVDRVTAAVSAHVGRVPGAGNPQPAAPVAQLRPPRLAPDEPCPGCGALPQRGRNGVSRLHGETCSYVASHAPQLRPSN